MKTLTKLLLSLSCPTLCEPIHYSVSGFPVRHYLLDFVQTHVIGLVMPFNHLILCCPLLLLPSVFPSIRVFSNESALHIRWPKYWTSSFTISPSMNVQGWSPLGLTGLTPCSSRDSQESSPSPQFESINSSVFSFIMAQFTYTWLLYMTTGKIMCVLVVSDSFVIPWTVAHQAPLSM